MSRRIQVAVLSLTVLIAATAEAGAVTLIQVDNKPDARIEIVPIDDVHRSAIPATLSSTGVKPPPGSFILINRTSASITAIDVRWNYTDSKGELKHSGITCDAYVFAPLDPIVGANDLSLITPYGCTRQYLFPRLATGGLIGSSVVPSLGDPISVDPHATVHLYIDSVIFEDGQILGPDKFQYYMKIKDRYSVVKNFVEEVAAARSAGEDLPSLAARIRKDAESRTDTPTSKASSRRAYYAGLLQRSRNPEAALRQLQEQVPPPTFYHTGEQHQ
jgi:hypothetical protein